MVEVGNQIRRRGCGGGCGVCDEGGWDGRHDGLDEGANGGGEGDGGGVVRPGGEDCCGLCWEREWVSWVVVYAGNCDGVGGCRGVLLEMMFADGEVVSRIENGRK